MSIGHHSITIKWKNLYTFGMTKCFKRGSEIYRLWKWAIVDRIKEDTIHVSRYSLINRQSERDRRCLRKLEELS